MDLYEIGIRAVMFFVPFLFALCFHEYAHGWVAKLRGDNTAQMMGRLTMNPISHMDMVGTVILPLISIIFPTGIFFGWAKPVPVNERNLKNPRTDMFWIALAGPLSNILLAIVAAIALRFSVEALAGTNYAGPVTELLKAFITVNLFLAVFNIIPLHPLDGGKVLARFLPENINRKLEENEQITSMLLLMIILFGGIRFLVPVVQGLYEVMIRAAFVI